MRMDEERRGNVLIVRPGGRIDTSTCDELETALAGRLDEGATRLVVDMGAVDYIGSGGLRVLLLAARRLRAKGGLLVLAALPPGVRHVFELAGFLTLFAVEPDPERAVSRAAGGE